MNGYGNLNEFGNNGDLKTIRLCVSCRVCLKLLVNSRVYTSMEINIWG